MLIFKGSRKTWEDGKDAVYKTICNGRYGCYDGKWIDLKGKQWDERTHNCSGKYELHINDWFYLDWRDCYEEWKISEFDCWRI